MTKLAIISRSFDETYSLPRKIEVFRQRFDFVATDSRNALSDTTGACAAAIRTTDRANETRVRGAYMGVHTRSEFSDSLGESEREERRGGT